MNTGKIYIYIYADMEAPIKTTNGRSLRATSFTLHVLHEHLILTSPPFSHLRLRYRPFLDYFCMQVRITISADILATGDETPVCLLNIIIRIFLDSFCVSLFHCLFLCFP